MLPEEMGRVFRLSWLDSSYASDAYNASSENLAVHLAGCDKCDHENTCPVGKSLISRFTLTCQSLKKMVEKDGMPKPLPFFRRLKRAMKLIR